LARVISGRYTASANLPSRTPIQTSSRPTKSQPQTTRTASCSLEHELVDEINLLTFPVIIGQGTRLFADTGPDVALDLVDTRTTPNGVTIQVFRPSGRPQFEPRLPAGSGRFRWTIGSLVESRLLSNGAWSDAHGCSAARCRRLRSGFALRAEGSDDRAMPLAAKSERECHRPT
jgi:hypothetical protein